MGKSYLPRRIQQLRVKDTEGIFLVLKYFCTERKTVRKGKNHLHYKLDKPNQSEKVSSRERKKKPPPPSLPPQGWHSFAFEYGPSSLHDLPSNQPYPQATTPLWMVRIYGSEGSFLGLLVVAGTCASSPPGKR